MAQQAAMQAALNAHDHVRCLTNLPLFFGRADKDSISVRLLVDRIETAAQIAGWNDDARKLQEMYMILCDRAVVWWRSLPDAGIDRDIWKNVKNEFLAMYEPWYTAKTTCTKFHELVQQAGESIQVYYLRVCETFDKMCEAKPGNIGTLRTVPAAVAAAAILAADLTTMKTEGIKDMEQFFQHQLFMAGLRDDIRAKVMEAGKTTLHESMRYAQEIEVIQHDKQGHAVAAVTAVTAANTSDTTVAEEEEDKIHGRGAEGCQRDPLQTGEASIQAEFSSLQRKREQRKVQNRCLPFLQENGPCPKGVSRPSPRQRSDG